MDTSQTLTLWDQFAAGGLTMYALLFLSIMALATAIERSLNFREKRILSRDFAKTADKLWQAGEFEKLSAQCEERKTALSKIIAAVVKYRKHPYSDVSLAVSEIASSSIKGHMQRTYMLSIVATISPLIGLFGTVVGMIEAFHVIAQSGNVGNAALVAGGISKALTTTAAGLLVGIPALGLKHYFTSRIQKVAISLEEEANELINKWLLEGKGNQ